MAYQAREFFPRKMFGEFDVPHGKCLICLTRGP